MLDGSPNQKSRRNGFFDHTPKATDSENFHFPKIQKKPIVCGNYGLIALLEQNLGLRFWFRQRMLAILIKLKLLIIQ